MADYYVFKMPKHPRGDGMLDKAQLVELEALATAVSGSQKPIYVSGPHDTVEQKATIKAVRDHLIRKGVAPERITTTKPVGEALSLAGHTPSV